MLDINENITLNDNECEQRSEQEDECLYRREFVVVDVETTGLSVEENTLLRIDAIKRCDLSCDKRVTLYIKQESKLPEEVSRLTGITEADLKNAVSEKEALERFADFIGDLTMVFYNADFELAFLNKACKKYGITMGSPYIDLFKTCKELMPEIRYIKDVYKALGINRNETSSDVYESLQMFTKIMTMKRRREGHTHDY